MSDAAAPAPALDRGGYAGRIDAHITLASSNPSDMPVTLRYSGSSANFEDSYCYGPHRLTFAEVRLFHENDAARFVGLKIVRGEECTSGDGRSAEQVTVRILTTPLTFTTTREYEWSDRDGPPVVDAGAESVLLRSHVANTPDARGDDEDDDDGEPPYVTGSMYAPASCMRGDESDFAACVNSQLGIKNILWTAKTIHHLLISICSSGSLDSSHHAIGYALRRSEEYLARDAMGEADFLPGFAQGVSRAKSPGMRMLYS